MTTDELADVARELLRVAPGDFIAARTARAREARGSDRDLARAIGGLRKPVPAAWAIDLLAAQGLLDEAAALAPELRRAQAAADPTEIGRLRVRRRDLVHSLTDAAADLAAEAGAELGAAAREQLSATIEAATADPRAAAAVRSGLLVRALESVGFEPVDLAGAVAVPDAVPEAAEVPDEPAGDDLADLLRASRPAKRAAGRRTGDVRTVSVGRKSGRRRPEPAAEGTEPEPEPEPPERPDPRILRDARDAASAAERALADLDDRIRAAEEQLRAAEDQLRDLEDRRGPLDRELREARRAVSRAERDAEG